LSVWLIVFFFFQAEDGIRDFHVTGVQTCALPIWRFRRWNARAAREDRYGFAEYQHARSGTVPYHERAALPAGIQVGDLSDVRLRSEERRVGKECRSGLEAEH